MQFELVVLATGIVPQTEGLPAAIRRATNSDFSNVPDGARGSMPRAACSRPGEVSATVQDATGAALKALQCAKRSVRHA